MLPLASVFSKDMATPSRAFQMAKVKKCRNKKQVDDFGHSWGTLWVDLMHQQRIALCVLQVCPRTKQFVMKMSTSFILIGHRP